MSKSTLKILVPLMLAGIVIFAASTFLLYSETIVINSKLDHAKLNFESLLAEKLSIEKALVKARRGFSALRTSQADISKRLLIQKETIRHLASTSDSLSAQLAIAKDTLKKQVSHSDSLEVKLVNVIGERQRLLNMNRDASDSIRTLLMRQEHVQRVLDTSFSLGNIGISAFGRSKKKLNLHARKIRCLVALVEVPSSFESLSFELGGPGGFIASDLAGNLSTNIVHEQMVTASIKNKSQSTMHGPLRIEISYHAEDRLRAGVYTFKVLNKGQTVGSESILLQ